jgi:putative ABC transport system ATP-binding protein/lipoprotein-releasing system ATP-binding protein
VDIATANRRRLAQVRRESIGMVFQSGELLPELSPEENVMVAALLAGKDVATAQRLARDILASLGVPSGSRSVTEFSGGERQRVAVARALVNRPRLVLADEPTGSLDPATRDTVTELLYQLPRQFDCALVVVTHDPVVAQQADQLVNLDQHQLIHEPIA